MLCYMMLFVPKSSTTFSVICDCVTYNYNICDYHTSLPKSKIKKMKLKLKIKEKYKNKIKSSLLFTTLIIVCYQKTLEIEFNLNIQLSD